MLAAMVATGGGMDKDIDGAMAGFALVARYWAALASDDDAATAELFYPMSRLRHGLELVGLAADLRGRHGFTREQCASMAASTTARRMPDGSWAYGCFPAWREHSIITGSTPAQLLLVHVDDDGRRWIWGYPDANDWAAGHRVELPLEDAPGGPVH